MTACDRSLPLLESKRANDVVGLVRFVAARWWLAMRLAIGPIACYSASMPAYNSMTVSELKNKLLEVVRRVQKGEVFEITKDGDPVAVLGPRATWDAKVTGFARIEVKGPLELPAEQWTYDIENLSTTKKRSR
jgi:prevent-host-death family protein